MRLSLADQIAQLDEAAPVDFDPEDVLARPEPLEDVVEPARDHYLEVGPSALRKLQTVADPIYDGVKTSRKQLMEADEEEGSEPEDSASGSDEDDAGGDGEGEGEASQHTPSESEEEADANAQQPSAAATKEPADELSSALQKTRDADRKKGKAVARQIKAVSAAQRLPTSGNLTNYHDIPKCRAAMDKMLEEALSFSDDLFDLQEKLLSANTSIAPPPRKRRKLAPDASLADCSAELYGATAAASALEHTYHPYLVQNLTKWSSKIQAVAPAALLPSNRNAFSSRNSQNLKSAVQLIDETLADQRKLVARTQVRRGKGARLGEEGKDAEADGGDNAVDVEVFDDTDFYQQLLRDVIDSRSNAGGGDDWMAIQRQKKAKKKVDTKASKGRKIRYDVHEKLQNFMVPVPVSGMWHDEQIDELFSSLLGRGFEGALGKEPDEDATMDVESGFRVF
ncbi:Sorting nexin-41 [Mycena kentingensis (nom. inval.)]|nr:Sorting nexin-41 [Mycena kentingensis (nom. inval.)]